METCLVESPFNICLLLLNTQSGFMSSPSYASALAILYNGSFFMFVLYTEVRVSVRAGGQALARRQHRAGPMSSQTMIPTMDPDMPPTRLACQSRPLIQAEFDPPPGRDAGRHCPAIRRMPFHVHNLIRSCIITTGPGLRAPHAPNTFGPCRLKGPPCSYAPPVHSRAFTLA